MINDKEKEIKQFLLAYFTLDDLTYVFNGIKNPVKNKRVVQKLEEILCNLESIENSDEKKRVIEFLEDQIAFCKFAIQDSKCDPTKFIDFS